MSKDTPATAPQGSNTDLPKPPVDEAKGDGKFTPDELARRTGHLRGLTREQAVKIGAGTPTLTTEAYSWQHAAAAQLHGWHAHAHHAGEPIRLTKQDYEGALKAVEKPVTRVLGDDGKPGAPLDAQGVEKLNGTRPLVHNYEPHKPALSPHAHGATKEVS